MCYGQKWPITHSRGWIRALIGTRTFKYLNLGLRSYTDPDTIKSRHHGSAIWPPISLIIRHTLSCSDMINCIMGFMNILCLCWGLTSQSTIFQSCRDGATASWVINQYFRGVKCLAQGHNTAVVGIEPPTSRSGVRHSTTEPPRSPGFMNKVAVEGLWPRFWVGRYMSRDMTKPTKWMCAQSDQSLRCALSG